MQKQLKKVLAPQDSKALKITLAHENFVSKLGKREKHTITHGHTPQTAREICKGTEM